MKFVSGNGLGLLLSALKTRFDGKLDKAARGAANGVASLDDGGKVPASQLQFNIVASASEPDNNNGLPNGTIFAVYE